MYYPQTYGAESLEQRGLMVFDWEKAAEIIKESSATYAEAGLLYDLTATVSAIFEEGKPVIDHKAYTFSCRDVPVLIVGDNEHIFKCAKYLKPEECPDSARIAHQKFNRWTACALAILG